MTDPYAFNVYLFQRGRKPAGVREVEATTTYVRSPRPHPRQKIHRIEFLASAQIRGRTTLGARYLCGDGSAEVVEVEDADQRTPCARCERLHSHDSMWSVYCYRDAQGAPLYIGQTFWLEERDRAHAVAKKSAAWWPRQVELEVLSRHASADAALEAEREAIVSLAPEFNIQHNKRSAA